MKKSILMKVALVLVITIMGMLFLTTVNAADDDGMNDLTRTLTSGSGNNSSNTGNTNTNTSGNNSNTSNNSLVVNNNTTNNNASVYNNSNLPKTGIGDSVPVALLLVVFGISAVYAYKKVKDYRNI